MSHDLSCWTRRSHKACVVMDGRYTWLEPLDPARHGDALLEQSAARGAEERFRYLVEPPPATSADLRPWLDTMSQSQDPMFWAVVDKTSGRAAGRQALMRIEPAHGVVEIGSILWGPANARTRVATEALYLFAAHVF